MRTLKNYLPGTGMLKALSILLAALLIFSGAAGEVFATEVDTAVEDVVEQELTPVEAYIFEYLGPWQNTTFVNEFFLSSGKILQLHIIEPLAGQGDQWYTDLSTALARLLAEYELDHARLFIDFIDAHGARIDSFDIDLKESKSLHAWFESAEEGATGSGTPLAQTVTSPETESTDQISADGIQIIRPRPNGVGSVPVEVLDHFSEWNAPAQLRQFSINDKTFLSFTVHLDIDDETIDASDLYALIEEAKTESWFIYDRIYIDLVSLEGFRYGSFEVDLVADENKVAAFEFDHWLNEWPVSEPSGGPEYEVGDMLITMDDSEEKVFSDDARVIYLTFTIKNISADGAFAPIENLQIEASQGGEPLNLENQIDMNQILLLPAGESISARYGFQLSSDEQLEIVLTEIETENTASFTLMPLG